MNKGAVTFLGAFEESAVPETWKILTRHYHSTVLMKNTTVFRY